jgi:NodT family efflux transporter outer membrane factor (OMF) lipoprotein
MKLRTPLLLAALAALGGCTVGPNFRRPAAPSATAYTGPSDPLRAAPGAPATVPGEGPGLRWWEAFGSPALDALVDRAIAGNYSLAASNATLERAREQIAAAAGRRLPQIDANARVEHEEVNLAAFGFNPAALGGSGNPEFNLYTVGGGVTYDLDLFGGKRRQVEQAAAQAEAQLRQTEAAHLTIAGRVVNQVLTIAAIRTRVAAANALLAEDQRNVGLTEARRRAGEGTLVEVLNAQSQLAADRGDLPQLGQELEEARHMLATLVGIAPAELGPTDFELAQFRLPADIPVTLPSALIHKRPDILQSEADLHAATAAIGVATARLYPDINLGATLTQAAPSLGNLLGAGFRGFDIFGALTAPIFHGGTLKAEKREAVDMARAAAATYQQTVLDAFRQVADLLDAIKSDSGSVESQRQAVDVAARSLHLSRRSFQVGNSGILQVLESQRLYQRARLALVDDQQRQYLNVARLYVATAGGWTGPAEVEASSAPMAAKP